MNKNEAKTRKNVLARKQETEHHKRRTKGINLGLFDGREAYNPIAGRLPSSISHFPSLASEASGTFLLPLGTHATLHAEAKGDSVGLRKVKGTGGQGGGVLLDSHEVLGNELDVLNRLLKVVQGSVLAKVDREGRPDGSDKDLHYRYTWLLRNLKGEQTAGDKCDQGLRANSKSNQQQQHQ